MPINRRFSPICALYLAIFASLGCLLFYHLDSRLLWGDEAETALLAKNVLKYGVPKSYDGVNRISLLGAHIDSRHNDIWTWTPWLQEYVAAASFAVFGQTTWAARAVFTFCAWLSLGLLAFVAHRLYHNHWITVSSVLLLGTSEVFLLHARQCRYYSIALLAEIALVFGIHQLLAHNRKGVATVAIALIIQFYSNYIIAAANIPMLLVLAWSLFREKKPASLLVIASLAIVFVAALPWLIYANPFGQLKMTGSQSETDKVLLYLNEANFHFLPWIFLLLPLGGWIKHKYFSKGEATPAANSLTRLERHLLILLPFYVAIIATAPGWYLRYLLPVFPVLCLLAAAWLFRYLKWPTVALALVLIQCSTNLLGWSTAYPWRGKHVLHSPILKYCNGINGPYADRVSEVVTFLNQHAQPGQTLFTTDPEFALIYYTGLAIIDARLNGGQIPEPSPDWILQQNASGGIDEFRIYLSGPSAKFYDVITLPILDGPRVGDIPEPDYYQYTTASNRSEFVIYRNNKLPPR